jgi:hypothetical protein
VFQSISGDSKSVIEQQTSGSYKDDKNLENVLKNGYQAKNAILAVSILYVCLVFPTFVLDIIFIVAKYGEMEFINIYWLCAQKLARLLITIMHSSKFYTILAVENDFKQALSYTCSCGMFMFSKTVYGSPDFSNVHVNSKNGLQKHTTIGMMFKNNTPLTSLKAKKYEMKKTPQL